MRNGDDLTLLNSNSLIIKSYSTKLLYFLGWLESRGEFIANFPRKEVSITNCNIFLYLILSSDCQKPVDL